MRTVLGLSAVTLVAVITAACSATPVADDTAVVADTTPFSCYGITCQPGEYCRGQLAGTGSGHSYTCHPIPAACASDVTCGCLQANVPMGPSADCFGVSCTGDGEGHVTLECGGE